MREEIERLNVEVEESREVVSSLRPHKEKLCIIDHMEEEKRGLREEVAILCTENGRLRATRVSMREWLQKYRGWQKRERQKNEEITKLIQNHKTEISLMSMEHSSKVRQLQLELRELKAQLSEYVSNKLNSEVHLKIGVS